MPHDVIMPALGMAQDEGLIVAWLKQPGEAVAEGEALMEVETDKATMEVEAQASGYLTDVRAGAGESVPVGQCVAVIADSPDAIRVQDAPAPASEPGPGASGSDDATADALPEGHDVIMPALGMAQDSGLIVAWHAEPGAKLAAGDVLLEVETDKATMEVEADRAGFLAAILAEAGDEVPVGDRIAILTDIAPDAPLRRALAQAPQPPAPQETPRQDTPPPPPAAPAPEPGPHATAAPSPGGRILASPKARRLAAEEGLDLADLVAAGHPQPFHVADLDTLRALPKPQAAPTAAAAAPGTITAEAPAEALDAFRDWFAAEHGAAPDGPRLFAGFAAAALRAATGAEQVTVAAGRLGPTRAMTDPDRLPLAATPEESDAPPALILRDLTASAITALAPGAGTPPVLTLTARNESLVLHLTHDEGALPQEAALALIGGVAARIAQPLRHLL